MTSAVVALEERILRGEKVSTEEYASAQAAEAAESRFAELERQREELQAKEERLRRATEKNAELLPKLRTLVSDERLESIKGEIADLIVEFKQRAMARDAAIADALQEIAQYKDLSPGFGWSFYPSHAEGVAFTVEGVNVSPTADWEMELVRSVGDVLASNGGRSLIQL